MLVVSLFNAWWDTAIYDETAHIPAGYSYLTQKDMRLNPEHPPLLKNLSAIPLLFMDLNFDTAQKFWTEDVNGQWDAGRNFLWDSGNNPDMIIFWSRVPFIILSLLLGLFIFKWTKEIAGIWAGLFALVLYAFDPNILGHNHFVTTDLGIAAFMTFSFYYFIRFIKDPSWKNVFLFGTFLGLVQLAKFSSIMLFPIYGLIIFIYPFAIINRKIKDNTFDFKLQNLWKYLGKGIVAFLLSLIIVWIVYAFNTYKMPAESLEKTINYSFNPQDTANIKNIYTNRILLALNKNSVLRPMSEYILGVSMVFKRVAGGNSAYFLGEVSKNAFVSYFPTVFLIKETIILLFLTVCALMIALIRRLIAFEDFLTRPDKDEPDMFEALGAYIRHNLVQISLFAFIILYSYISITGNLNIGFRHLFPILPFIYILIAKTIFDVGKKILSHQNKMIMLSSLIVLSIILITNTVAAYPNYMSYFNPLAGGPKNGYKLVTDSNADWGQDLRRLQKFLKDHPEIDKIRVDYFGGADIRYYIKDKYISWWDSKRPIEPGWYAISTNFLQGSLYDKEKNFNNSYQWIKKFQPKYQVGTSLLIYHIEMNDIN